jgi:opacity protein-like surface antigen
MMEHIAPLGVIAVTREREQDGQPWILAHVLRDIGKGLHYFGRADRAPPETSRARTVSTMQNEGLPTQDGQESKRHMKQHVAFLALIAAVTLSVPASARADGLITPFVGSDFGGDAGNCAELVPCSTNQLAYGLGLGFMVGGVIGFEGEFAYAPHFFGDVNSSRSDNSLLTMMGDVIAGIPIKAVRPYAVGGLGLLHTNVSQSLSNVTQTLNNNSLAFDAGGGLMILFSSHVGVRGDLRYVRTLSDVKLSELGLANRQLQWGRGYLGVVFRF